MKLLCVADNFERNLDDSLVRHVVASVLGVGATLFDLSFEFHEGSYAYPCLCHLFGVLVHHFRFDFAVAIAEVSEEVEGHDVGVPGFLVF